MNELILNKLDSNLINQAGRPVGAVIGSNPVQGTALADDTAAIQLVAADFGKTFTCALDGAAKTVNLPVSVTADDVGKSIKIYQSVSLVASGVLTFSVGTGNVMALNSVFCGAGVTVIRPDNAEATTLTISGANTNSAFGAGSTITATVVDAGKYMVEVVCVPLGTGSDAVAVA